MGRGWLTIGQGADEAGRLGRKVARERMIRVEPEPGDGRAGAEQLEAQLRRVAGDPALEEPAALDRLDVEVRAPAVRHGRGVARTSAIPAREGVSSGSTTRHT